MIFLIDQDIVQERDLLYYIFLIEPLLVLYEPEAYNIDSVNTASPIKNIFQIKTKERIFYLTKMPLGISDKIAQINKTHEELFALVS